MSPKKAAREQVAPSNDKGGHAEGTLKTSCAVGDCFNEVQFPSPVYVSTWLSKDVVAIGGGGGARFGYANTLTLLRVDIDDAKALWSAVASVDFGDGIVWEASAAVDPPPSASTANGTKSSEKARALCVSHVDSFSVVEFTPPAALAHICRVTLMHDKDNPDKKPITVANGTVFVAQDNNTIAAFDLDGLYKKAAKVRRASKSELAPVFPLLRDGERESEDDLSWRLGILGGLGLGDRISGLDCRGVDADTTLMAATCLDKKLRVALLKRRAVSACGEEGDAANDASTRRCTWSAATILELGGAELKLPLPLMKSSLRFAKMGPVLPDAESKTRVAAQVLTVAYSARTGFSYIVNGAVRVDPRFFDSAAAEVCDGDRQPSLQFSLFSNEPAVGVVRDAITSMCAGGVTSTSFLCSTTEGSVVEVQCPAERNAGGTVKALRCRVGVHKEPISSISVPPIDDEGSGTVITTDIAQRVRIWKLGTAVDAAAERDPLKSQLWLFPLQINRRMQKLWRLAMAILIALIATIAALIVQQLLL